MEYVIKTIFQKIKFQKNNINSGDWFSRVNHIIESHVIKQLFIVIPFVFHFSGIIYSLQKKLLIMMIIQNH